jgi:hypothetical protein
MLRFGVSIVNRFTSDDVLLLLAQSAAVRGKESGDKPVVNG